MFRTCSLWRQAMKIKICTALYLDWLSLWISLIGGYKGLNEEVITDSGKSKFYFR